MDIIDHCPICRSAKRVTLFSVEHYPFFTVPVKKEDKKTILQKFGLAKLSGELHPVACPDCGHLYLSKTAPDEVISELYSKYYNYPSAMEGSFLPVRDQAFIHVFEKQISKLLKSGQQRVLEIGCYDGYILNHLKGIGFEVTGCDPSPGALIGQKYGLDIKKQFFRVEDFVAKKLTYDVVIFRHFLEHVSLPVDFLKSMTKILNENGHIIFEVPNAEFYLKTGGTTVFSFQHLQYFSNVSISNLLAKAGLKMIKCVAKDDNLIVVAAIGKTNKPRNPQSILKLCKSFQRKFELKKKKFKTYLNQFKGKNLLLWGAGGFSCNITEIYELMGKHITGIVDSDKNKWEMEYLQHSISIAGPNSLERKDHGGIIVCSMYAKEILKTLKKLRYEKPVINFFPNLEMIRK